jgi:peroxiredoxin
MAARQKYKYFVWEKGITDFSEFLIDPSNKPMFRYSPSGTKMLASKDWGTFDHIYDEEQQFVFDTGKFQRPIKEAKITTSGWELADQFNRLFEDKYMLTLESVNPLNQPGSHASHAEFDIDSHFYKMYAKWDSLEASYDPFFKDRFVEQKLYMYQIFSPMRNRKNPLYNPRITKEDSIAFLNSESFHNNFEELVSLVKHLDPDSYFYEGRFVYNVLIQIPSYLRKWPELESKYDITVDNCLALLDDFADNAKNPNTRQSVLYKMQSRYTKMDSTVLAQKYRKQLFDEFPDGPYVKHIEEEKTRSYWDKVSPYPAPNISVTTLDGNSISLTDYRGTFVFVDFWGSWCAPCKREIPEIIDMAKYIPEEKLKIIGLANDDEKSLRQYVEKHNINYANALADQELLAAWDIKSYPTNFLIDPDGNVIGKNFRGGSQFHEISTEMERWEKERSE